MLGGEVDRKFSVAFVGSCIELLSREPSGLLCYFSDYDGKKKTITFS